jgi:hypothetical protein
MALLGIRSQFTDGRADVAPCSGSEVRAIHPVLSLVANPSANDVAHLVDLPMDHVPIAAFVDASDIDTNGVPQMTLSIGVLNAGKTDLTDTWLAASTIAQTGIASAVSAAINMFRTTPTQTGPLSIGLKFPASAATFAAGTIGATILYRRSDPTRQ